MSVLVANCPRCAAELMTFDVKSQVLVRTEYEWKKYFEVFSICRNCHRSTVFVISLQTVDRRDQFVKDDALVTFPNSLNQYFEIRGFISLLDRAAHDPPEDVPPDIAIAFREAATCMSVECWNAGGAMFRACVDLATRPLLPEADVDGLNRKIRRDLGLRLPWLFKNHLLPDGLNELSSCIREDGNDGAHAVTLTKVEAEDLLDFTTALLERLFTEPARLKEAEKRRELRRATPPGGSR